MAFRLHELAEAVGALLEGDPERLIEGVRDLESAGPGDLAFLTDSKYHSRASTSRAGALLVPEAVEGLTQDLLRCSDPGAAMVTVLELFHPRSPRAPGIHPTAVVGEGTRVSASAFVGAYVIVGDNCTIGDDCVLDGHVWVGDRVELGRGTRLHSHVSVYDDSRIGDRVEVHSGAVLGADGHGYLHREGRYRKVPQVGRVWIESDVEIGANSAVDRATLETTRIGRGTKIDNLVQVGHNVQVGENGMLCAFAGVAGSARLGDNVVMAAKSGVADHQSVPDGVTLAAKAAVLKKLGDDKVVGGVPAVSYSKWRRQVVLLGKLEELLRRVRKLERRLSEREEGQP